MFLQPPIRHVATVARQHLRLGKIGDWAVLVGIAEDELTRLQRRTRAGGGFLAGALHHRLRESVAEPEMVVGVVERWCRVEVEERQTPDAVGPRQQLVVLRDRAPALLVGAGEQDRDRVHVLTGQAADPAFGSGCAGVAEDVRAGCHSFAELVGKGGQRLLGHAERAKAIPRERQRDPAIRAIHGGLHIRRRLHLVEQLGQPRPATCGGVERQELVAPGDRRSAGQQDVLDVVELEHLLHLVEHVGEGSLQAQRLLDLIGGDVRILAVLEEAGEVVLAHELHE